MINPHDQTLCPKCGRMYREGYWGEGVCTADMHFGGEPTSDFDEAGRCLRVWYEAHRETWWDRSSLSRNQTLLRLGCADEFMLGLLNEVSRINSERERPGRGARTMKPLAALFVFFALLGLIFALMGHAAKQNSPAPSMVTNNASPAGYALFIVCGLIAIAAYASH